MRYKVGDKVWVKVQIDKVIETSTGMFIEVKKLGDEFAAFNTITMPADNDNIMPVEPVVDDEFRAKHQD
jgi:acyl-CoA thioesterase FadM